MSDKGSSRLSAAVLALAGGAAAQAHNRLANFTAFSLQNDCIGKLIDTDDTANRLWLRCANPFKRGETNGRWAWVSATCGSPTGWSTTCSSSRSGPRPRKVPAGRSGRPSSVSICSSRAEAGAGV